MQGEILAIRIGLISRLLAGILIMNKASITQPYPSD